MNVLTNLWYRNKIILLQAVKFIVAGILNTATDLIVLNILVFIFKNTHSSITYPIFKTISFLIALTLSYFLNKYWVFSNSRPSSKKKEKVLFVIVSCVAFLMNVLVASLVFIFLNNIHVVGSTAAANIGALAGTLTVLVWNFVCYKFVVFKA